MRISLRFYKYLTFLCIYKLGIFAFVNKNNLYKGCLEPIILKLLDDNGSMYGYEITQKVKQVTAGQFTITEGALYPLLHRLEAAGVLNVKTENIGNRIRKYYFLTKAGKKEKLKAIKNLEDFKNTLQLLLNSKLA